MPTAAYVPRRKLATIASALFILVLTSAVSSAASAGMSLSSSISDGQTISGAVTWEVTPSGGTPSQVVYLIDGTSRWTERYAPYVFDGDGSVLDTRALTNGTHRLEAVAYSGSTVAARSVANVTVANGSSTPTPPPSGSRADLARGKPTSASSSYNSSYTPNLANDGNGASRWSSNFTDNQWWQVDLGSAQTIDTVWINWEDAYAKSYAIQVSQDGLAFTGVANDSIASARAETTTFSPVTARFVRIVGLTRGTPYGISAWDIEVYGAAPSPPPPTNSSPVPADLASGKSASASSSYSSTYTPDKANDGNSSTRWSSSFADGEWWQVDLGSAQMVDTVSINWEDAYAKSYKIEVSPNGTAFTNVASDTASSAGAKSTNFAPVNARFVRIVGLTRATSYGVSAWEIRVLAASSGSAGTPTATALPSVSGSTTVGAVLQATPGTWTSSPSSFAYQWQRCDALGDGCADISGATGSSYTLTTADQGSTLVAVVTARNGSGTGTATSSTTSVIVAAAVTTAPSSLGSKLPSRLGPSTGATYYVDNTGGSDANPGTIDRPFGSISKAWSVAGAGATINVRGGTYGGQINLTNKAASAASPITVRAYGNEHVLLSGPSAEDYPAVYIWRSTGVRLQGFEIANDAGDGVKVDSGSDVEIVGNDIHGNGMQGIIVGSGAGSTAPTYSKNVQIWTNRIHDNGGWWSGGDPYALVGTHGIYYGNTGSNSDGIRHGAVGGVIADNLFYDQRFGYHIQVGSQNDGLVITNNTFDNASQPDTRAGNAVQIYGESNAFATKNVLVVNNIIANDANRGVYGSGPSMTSNVVRNNLTFNNPLGDIVPTYGSSTLFTVGSGNVTADPKFVDRSLKSYQLTSTSPAIGRADADYAPATDFTGRSRNGAPDLGAVEHIG